MCRHILRKTRLCVGCQVHLNFQRTVQHDNQKSHITIYRRHSESDKVQVSVIVLSNHAAAKTQFYNCIVFSANYYKLAVCCSSANHESAANTQLPWNYWCTAFTHLQFIHRRFTILINCKIKFSIKCMLLQYLQPHLKDNL